MDRLQEKTDEIIRLRHELSKRDQAKSFAPYRVGLKDSVLLTERFITVKAPSANEAIALTQDILTALGLYNFWIVECMGVN